MQTQKSINHYPLSSTPELSILKSRAVQDFKEFKLNNPDFKDKRIGQIETMLDRATNTNYLQSFTKSMRSFRSSRTKNKLELMNALVNALQDTF